MVKNKIGGKRTKRGARKNLNDISDTYILNHYQYFDCSGNIKSNNNQIFNQEQLDKFYSNNYFGVASDAEYTTQQDTKNKYNNMKTNKKRNII